MSLLEKGCVLIEHVVFEVFSNGKKKKKKKNLITKLLEVEVIFKNKIVDTQIRLMWVGLIST